MSKRNLIIYNNQLNMRIYFTLIASVFIVAGVSSRSLSSSDGVTPPYVNYFDDGDSSLDGYTLINLNDDGTNWTVVDGKAGMDGNAAQPMDAWLITPAIRLGTDYIYEMTLDGICQDAGKTERVEVFLGTAPTVEAMTTRIMERTNVMRTYPVSYWNSFDLKSEGTYYIGIHGCSNAGSSRLLIDNLGVRPWRSTAFPAAIDDLTAVVDNVGKMMVDISFTAPSVTYSGQPLTSITRIELKLNGVLVHTFDAPSPGERLSYSGKVIAKGDYTYSAVVVNEAGESFPAETVVRAGVTRPAPVTVPTPRSASVRRPAYSPATP